MNMYQGYDAFVATYLHGDYPVLKQLPGVRIEEVPRITGNWLMDSCAWLRKNARRIDVLSIYVLDRVSFCQAVTYRLFNPKGKLYLRLEGWPMRKNSSFWKIPFHKTTLKLSHLVSTEYSENVDMLSRDWHHRIVYSTIPVNPNEIDCFRPFSERSNVILTAGRLGTHQKATEILLEAFAKIADEIPTWTLKLAGRIEENMNIAADFYAKYPGLAERVVFTGEIRDRTELTGLYRDAKIFAFPSRWESFGIALAEAMMQGDFAVVSKIASSQKLTDDYSFALGSDVDDAGGLAGNLLYACTHEAECERLAIEGMNVTRKRLDLRRCCEEIVRS